MDCRDTQKFIQAYLDGELVEDERVSVAAHLETCSACSRVARFEQRFKERVMASHDGVAAPSRLRARLAVAFDQVDEQRRAEQAARQQRRRWTWRLAPSFALAAAAAAVVFVVLPGKEERDVVAEEAINWHRARLPMDVKGTQEAQIRRFFRDKVPFAVKLPRFTRARDAKLVGARLTNLQGQRVVALTYMVDGQRVSVFVAEPRVIRAQRTPRQPRWRDVRGYHVGTYVDGDTGYAITSEMDRRNLVRLVSH